MTGRIDSEAPAGAGERQYHLGLAPGEVAPSLLVVGDPERVERARALLSDPEPVASHREFVHTRGTYGGKPVSVLGTGIGADNTEIALVELSRIVDPAAVVAIRVGSSGAIGPAVHAGDLVVSTGAVRLESTSLAYVDPGFPALAHHDVVAALAHACEVRAEGERRFHVGLTATAPGFFAAQGRAVAGLPGRTPDRVESLAAQRVLNMEMECSCLFTLATLFGMRAGAVCAVFADRRGGVFLGPEERREAEARALVVGLDALSRL